MELSVEERYVSCALFTLALHSTVRDALTAEPFAESIDGKAAAIGYLERDDEFGIYNKVSEDGEARIANRVARGKPGPCSFAECQAWEMRGICERVFSRMKLPYKSWPGLLATPRQVLDTLEDREVLKSYVDSLIRTLQDDGDETQSEPGNREERPVPQAIGIMWALLDACIGTEEEVQGNEGVEHGAKSQPIGKERKEESNPARGYTAISPGKELHRSPKGKGIANFSETPRSEQPSVLQSSDQNTAPVGRKDTVYVDAKEYPGNQTMEDPQSATGMGEWPQSESDCSPQSRGTPSSIGKMHHSKQSGFVVEPPAALETQHPPPEEGSDFDKLLKERMKDNLVVPEFSGTQPYVHGQNVERLCEESRLVSEEEVNDIEFEANFDDDAEDDTEWSLQAEGASSAPTKDGETRANGTEVPNTESRRAVAEEDFEEEQWDRWTGEETPSEEDATFEAVFSDDEEARDPPGTIARGNSSGVIEASTAGEVAAKTPFSPPQSPGRVLLTDPTGETNLRDKVVILQDGALVRWYDARSRVALRRLAIWLRLSWEYVAPLESLLATQRAQPVIAVEMQEAYKDGKASKYRWLKVGAAATFGGAILALTGGLAAPALAAGVGTVMAAAGAGASAAMASAMLTTPVVAAGFGAAGAGIMGKKFDRLTAGIKELGFVSLGQAQAEDAEGDARRATDHENNFSAQQLFDTYDDVDLIDMGGHSEEEEEGKETPSKGEGEGAVCAASAAAYAALKAKERREPASLLDKITALSDEEEEETSEGDSGEEKAGTEGKGESSGESETLEKANIHPRHKSLVSDDKEHLAVTLAVSGWVRDMDDYTRPWYGLDRMDCERFCLVWESEELLALGKALESFVRSKVVTEGTKYWIAHTAAAGVLAACAWPSLILTASGFIDNAWAVALDRAEKLGRVLADVLAANFHGDKPITLIGYSLGAKSIFHCLEELHKRGRRGTVERAILLGTPIERNVDRWRKAREVVSGRLVNGYTMNDWVLGLVFRATNTNMAAGLSPVAVHGVENVNLSCLIEGHSDYPDKIGSILHMLKLA